MNSAALRLKPKLKCAQAPSHTNSHAALNMNEVSIESTVGKFIRHKVETVFSFTTKKDTVNLQIYKHTKHTNKQQFKFQRSV